MGTDNFSIAGFAWRVAFALVLVFATFNPAGYSYFHWVRGNFPSFTPSRWRFELPVATGDRRHLHESSLGFMCRVPVLRATTSKAEKKIPIYGKKTASAVLA